jgi:hypothetical protein
MPTSWNFDTVFPDYLTGTMWSPVVIDADGTPNNVLEIARPYTVKLDWSVAGKSACTLGGKWLVTISLESLGSGFEGPVLENFEVLYTAVAPGSTLTNRKWHIERLLTNPLPPADPHVKPGVFKLVVFILYHDPFDIPDPMAAFSEGPTISFYEPGP